MTLPTLRPPPGHVDVPAFDEGWLDPGPADLSPTCRISRRTQM